MAKPVLTEQTLVVRTPIPAPNAITKRGAFKARFDGWMSALSGIGGARDKAASFVFCEPAKPSDQELESLFRWNDLAHTIVAALPEDALRMCPEPKAIVHSGPEQDDEDPDAAQEKGVDMLKRLTELKAIDKLQKALIYGRLLGGAALIKVYKGKNTSTEVAEGVELIDLIMVDKRDLAPKEWYGDPLETRFGHPMLYTLQRSGPGGGDAKTNTTPTQSIEIHESRLIILPGADTSDRIRALNGGWDDSVLLRVLETLKQAGGNWASVCAMMGDMSQKVYKLKGFIGSLADAGEEAARDRLALMNATASVTNAIVLDADDESYEVVERGAITGVGDLVDRSWTRLAAAARMPVTRLMGQSPAGLNATGASDVRMWYDEVKSYQDGSVKSPLIEIMTAIDPSVDWDVSFPSLWQMTPAEEADYRNKVATTDKLYIDAQVILPEEIALSRFGQGKYSAEYSIDLDPRKASLDRDLESMETGEPTPEEQAAQELAIAQTQQTPGQAPGAKPPASGKGSADPEAEKPKPKPPSA